MKLTAREIEILDGLIISEIYHANQSEYLWGVKSARAEKKKALALEQVALLEKIKAWGTKTNDNPDDFKPF